MCWAELFSRSVWDWPCSEPKYGSMVVFEGRSYDPSSSTALFHQANYTLKRVFRCEVADAIYQTHNFDSNTRRPTALLFCIGRVEYIPLGQASN